MTGEELREIEARASSCDWAADPKDVLSLCAECARLRRDNARLRKWLRRWLDTAPISLGLNLATKRLRSEINAALKGDEPPKGGKR